MKSIDEHIFADDSAICENIDDLEYKARDKVAQNMLSYFRNLVEHIAVKIYAESHENAYVDYDTIQNAIEFLKTSNEFYFLRKFHSLLQESRSHYTPDNDGAERLLLKYYEYLLQIKDFIYDRYQINILHNIDKFPIDTDETLQIYYEKIIEKLKVNIAEWMGYCGYTSQLDDSLFDRIEDDEIILCLNYDGLYGINNINRFLQNANPNPPYKLGIWVYKIGDPILFNDSSKYDAILYNNLKGKIVNIEENEEYVWFSIEIDKVLNSIHVARTSLELLPRQNDGKSVVRFAVKKKKAGDDDNDNIDAETSIPFQIAYAVSIHKAQGLEYNSVKIVITKEVDEMITHNIFYTAITRTKKNLKIYWTSESQHKIIDSFVNDETSNDAKIFAARTGIKMIKRNRK